MVLYDGLQADTTEDWQDNMLALVEKMYANTTYEFDTVVTFIRGEYRKPIKNVTRNRKKAAMMKFL